MSFQTCAAIRYTNLAHARNPFPLGGSLLGVGEYRVQLAQTVSDEALIENVDEHMKTKYAQLWAKIA